MLDFKLSRTDELITSQAGLASVAEFCHAIDLAGQVRRHLPQPGSARGYEPYRFVLPLILTMIGGGEALDHTGRIANDRCLLKLLGLDKIPDPGTIGDWLRRTYELGYMGLRRVTLFLIGLVLASDPRTVYTLDADATAIESHKDEAKMTYKGFPGYMPMLANLGEIPLFLVDDFREGNVPPHARALDILNQAIEAMPEGKHLGYLRSDSAWYQAAIFNRCEQERIIFAITADQDKSVKELIATIGEWQPCVDRHGTENDREWGETVHCMNQTRKAFRLIVQRWRKAARPDCVSKPGQPAGQQSLFGPEYFYHVIAANSPDPAQEVIHWHNGRANSENWNKEIKLGFGMEHLPCGEFEANALYFRIGVLAYNLMVAMKYLVLPESWRQKTIKSLRWLWLGTAGKLVRHGRRWTLKLAGLTQAQYEAWRDVRLRCRLLS